MGTRNLLLALLLLVTVAAVPTGASDVHTPPELWTVTADGAAESPIATGPDGSTVTRDFDWSPDGSKLVFSKLGDIWTSAEDGSGQINLAAMGGIAGDPHWSPDGTQVVFVNTTGTGSDLYIAAADGSGVQPLTTDEGYERDPRWSPTGEWILFQSICIDCDEDLELIRPDASERLVLTDDDVRDLVAAWSPDGSQIAIVRGPGTTNGNELWMIDGDGTDLSLLSSDVAFEEPEWAPDGSHLIARTTDSSFSVVALDGTRTEVSSENDAPIFEWDWSPDSARIAFSSYGLHLIASDGTERSEVVTSTAVQSGDKVPDWVTTLDWAPDGSRIGFATNTDLFVWTVDASAGLMKLTERTYATEFPAVTWDPDSSTLAYLFHPVAGPGARTVSLAPSVRKLTFGNVLRLAGTVEATSSETPDGCIAGAYVVISRRVLGESRVRPVADVQADENGSFRIAGLKPDRSADYVATVVGPPFDCNEASSAAERIRVRKKVALSGPPISGGRVRFKADVEPCKGHRGDRVLLQRRKGGRWVTLAKDRSNDRCRAVFVRRLGRRSVFRAKAPKTDADHLAGRSPTLVIHVD